MKVPGASKPAEPCSSTVSFGAIGKRGKPASGASLSARHYPAGLVQNFRLRQSIVDAMAIKPKGHDFDLGRKVVIFRHMSVTGG